MIERVLPKAKHGSVSKLIKELSDQKLWSLLGIIIAGMICGHSIVVEGKGFLMSTQERGRVRAPEISGGRGWLNTDKPLSLAALKGKVVLLDFWTYGCINCIHIIPDLKKLEEKYANELVVIGVHSAKFENEKDTENIRRIILRYEIEHPVYNDAEFNVWRRYGVRAWPTQVLIDPAGYVIGAVSGEGNYDVIDQALASTIATFRERGELNEIPFQFSPESAKIGALPLAFPGKIIADAKGDRLIIADSNHNRIVITNLEGTVVDVIGTGEAGSVDGPFDKATFYRPQGMALAGNLLYIADTANHLIRKADLEKRTVETIAGTGRQSREYFRQGPALTIGLSSPWDVHLAADTLYIAMAGPHQIWKLDLEKKEISTFAGSGREARLDGALSDAGFAQPSGLATIENVLYVADSESNIIRSIDLTRGQVKTVVGGDLFEFGDVDGFGDEVRLQHPLGLSVFDGKLLIADTYNHKIKELNPESRRVKTFVGSGRPGQADGKSPTFYEPGGLAIAHNKLFIADTNNHAVRVVDLKTREVKTLQITGLQPAANSAPTPSGFEPNVQEISVQAQRVRSESDGTLVIDVELPNGYHLNPSAPLRYLLSIEKGTENFNFGSDEASAKQQVLSGSARELRLPLRLPFRALAPGEAQLRLQLTVVYCRKDNTGTCFIRTLVWRVPVKITTEAGAMTEIKVAGSVGDKV